MAISIHALREEGDLHPVFCPRLLIAISIHALREEGDHVGFAVPAENGNFYPRPPRGGRPALGKPVLPIESISIHALREEGDHDVVFVGECNFISIHALREEGDWQIVCRFGQSLQFLSTPSARRATDVVLISGAFFKFLSTPSARRATLLSGVGRSGSLDFYPRPPRGGRLQCNLDLPGVQCISIHALREEGDSKNRDKISIFKQIIQHSARI